MAIATTDHDEIRKWAESKGGKPAAVDRTHRDGDIGIIRLMFPDNPQSEHESLVEISWDEFFRQFEESKLALLYEKDSLFSKIVGRDTLERREHGEHVSRHHDGTSAGGRGQAEDSGSSADLKSREYRDEHGNVHHHTRTYSEQRGGKK